MLSLKGATVKKTNRLIRRRGKNSADENATEISADLIKQEACLLCSSTFCPSARSTGDREEKEQLLERMLMN